MILDLYIYTCAMIVTLVGLVGVAVLASQVVLWGIEMILQAFNIKTEFLQYVWDKHRRKKHEK